MSATCSPTNGKAPVSALVASGGNAYADRGGREMPKQRNAAFVLVSQTWWSDEGIIAVRSSIDSEVAPAHRKTRRPEDRQPAAQSQITATSTQRS